MHDWSKEIQVAICPLNLSAAREAGIVEELSQHLNDRYEELLISGVAEEQACRTLKQELTDGKLLAGLKATVRETSALLPIGREKQERLLAGIWNDLQYGARLLVKSPGFADLDSQLHDCLINRLCPSRALVCSALEFILGH